MILTPIIMAAGQGKRMVSELPKVLHPVLGKPMILHALDAVAKITDQAPVVIVGHGGEQVQQALQNRARCVWQKEQLGTAHAVLQARPLLQEKTDLVLVTSADLPLLRPETYARLVETQLGHASGPITMATVTFADSHGFGRIVRADDGTVKEIVEEAQASPAVLAIRELNAGVYCIRADWLWEALDRVPLSPKGEYYLTDLVGLAVSEGLTVRGITIEDPDEAVGVNTRVHLAEVERILRERINLAWMEKGITMIDPRTTTIGTEVTLGKDTTLYPGTILTGSTRVGARCVIGPNTFLRDVTLGDDCVAPYAYLENVDFPAKNHVEPFTRILAGRLRVDNPNTSKGL